MIKHRLKTLVLIYLSVALVEDIALFAMAWFLPNLWFSVFHASVSSGLEVTLLRRSAGQWIAFALAQSITITRLRKNPAWLAVAAGVRFSDLFTDISYVLAAPTLTTTGYVLLLPPPCLNLLGVVILLRIFADCDLEGDP
jgi:hypothetical protein